MPEGKDHLAIVHGHRHEPVELVLRPSLREERLREDDDPEAAARDPGIDLPPQAVADLELELVVPDLQTALTQCERERADDRLLVLGCV